MKNLFTLITMFIIVQLNAQNFYDLNTIQTIEITFAESNWDQLLDIEKAGDGDYIMAQSITINGEIMDSVGVKYKGNSTYNSNQVKNPFHIELNTFKNQDYDGYTDIKLSNVAKDPSFLREVLSYQILRQYMDAPLSNYANVFVNGNLIGLYTNSEAVSKKFVDDRFGSKNNTFVKCNPPAGAGPQSNDFPNLVYLGQDSSDYYDAYELKSDDGWDELIELCDNLENDINNIEDILDVDRALWMLAYDNVMVNLDSYIGAFAQNYYLYKDDNNRFVPVVWDLNESFGSFSMTGTSNLMNTTQKQQMDHLLHDTDNDFPLMKQLMSIPTYKRMYIAHFKTILLENFDNDTYFTTGLELQTLIDAAVQADGNKFFSYNNFIDNLNDDVTGGGGGPGGGGTPGITNLMDGRNDYLLGLSDFTQTAPTISNITPSNTAPIINETITITAAVMEENAVILGYRNQLNDRFTKIDMFDDGAHNDGAENDGVYGTEVLISTSFIQYFIYAENDNTGSFSPQRAEHEYHTLTATFSNTEVGDLVINEVMASNDFTVADQDGEYDDWIELYNNGTETINIEGYFLSDDVDDLMKWEFPTGTSIAAGDYLGVWADNDEIQDGLHTNFKLSATLESLFLVDPTGEIIDEVSFVDQTTDISFGRFPNGTGDFQIMSPTYLSENNLSTSSTSIEFEDFSLKAFPNPTSESFYLEISEVELKERDLFIYNMNGVLFYQDKFSESTWINTADWEAGMYLIKVENTFLKLVVI